MKASPIGSRSQAFALADALAVLAAVALLALFALPVIARQTTNSRLAQCFSNMKALSNAWLLYADENGGHLAPNPDGGDAGKTLNRASWAGGWLNFTPAGSNPDNLNLDLLMNYGPRIGSYGGLLGPYLTSASVFRCPADSALVRAVNNKWTPRLRSVSMNPHVNNSSFAASFSSSTFQTFKRIDHFNRLPPARAFLLIDEREDSMNDPVFLVEMSSVMNSTGQRTPASNKLIDFPAMWHERGTSLSFVDGHVEHWRWQDARTMPPYRENVLLPLNMASPSNPDVERIAAVTTVLEN